VTPLQVALAHDGEHLALDGYSLLRTISI